MTTNEAPFKLQAQHVDSFQPVNRKQIESYPKCSVRGCRKAGVVRIFYTETPGKQERNSVCVEHACHFANMVLTVYKFKRDA